MKPKISFVAALTTIAALAGCTSNNSIPPYLDDNQPIEVRVEDALQRMTLEEKVAMCHAQSKFSSPGVPRLGIPEVWCTDGPHGIREEVFWDEWSGAGWTNDACTAFPALTCLAATWDPEMSALYGKSIGEEARYRNKNVLLGPGVNIYRTPLNGRNFEYMGEDPYLASVMVVPYIQEVQKNGVATCVKHFALNNQENARLRINVTVSDRALREIYLPAFEAAVKQGGTWSIMGAYNQYNNEHCCHNCILLNDILKKEWGFDGTVISDWGGTHDTKQAAENGLDLEFGTWSNGLTWSASNAYDNYFLATPYLEGLKAGTYSEEQLDDKVRRILRMIFRTTMDRTRPFGEFVSPAHFDAARTIAQNGIVLLQNEGNLLPLSPDKVQNILVVGENANKRMTIGGGSSSLKVVYENLPLEGLQSRYGKDKITYMKGYTSGKDTVEELSELSAAAEKADAVIFIGGLNKHGHQDAEGGDRLSYGLPYGQDTVIETLVQANPRTVVVIISGNAVAMPWKERVPAIVEGWYCGTEAGNALASILAGDVNPSGKLPFTYYASLDQCGAHALGEYPGANNQVNYKDDIWVGYRFTEREKSAPLFPFGHGLSYTSFEYSDVKANKKSMSQEGKLNISVTVKNSGDREGSEIVQLYIGDKESSVPRPLKELKGFDKVKLAPGESRTVTFTIDSQALRFWDETTNDWKVEPGTFTAYVGASSADIRGTVDFLVK